MPFRFLFYCIVLVFCLVKLLSSCFALFHLPYPFFLSPFRYFIMFDFLQMFIIHSFRLMQDFPYCSFSQCSPFLYDSCANNNWSLNINLCQCCNWMFLLQYIVILVVNYFYNFTPMPLVSQNFVLILCTI